MPPPGYEPFLRAICENPEDDTVRLVYADWLDENGDPERAEFIRVSIEWSRMVGLSDQRKVLQDRIIELSRLHQKRWLGELSHPGIKWDTGFPLGLFNRGFPSVVTVLNGRVFAERAEWLFSQSPIQQLVFRRESFDHVRRALSCPAVGGITAFTILRTEPDPPGDELCGILARPHLRRLQFLHVARMGITNTGLAALAGAVFLPYLRQMVLDGNPVTESGIMGVVDRLSPGIVQRLILPAAPLGQRTQLMLRERFGDQLSLV